MLTWAELESTFWQTISNRCRERTLFRNQFPVRDLIKQANSVATNCRSFIDATDETARTKHERDIRSNLTAYRNPAFLLSGTPETDTINRLSETDPSAAWFAIVHARKQPYEINQVQNISELLRAWDAVRLEGLDIDARMKSHEEGLKQLRSRWSDRFSRTRKANELAQAGNRRRVRLYRKAAQRLLSAHEKAQAANQVLMDEMRSVHEARMARMEQEFSTEMQLRASEKFWSRKRKLNAGRAKSAFKKLCFSGGIGAIAMAGIYAFLYKTIGLPEGLNIGHGILYLLPAVLYLWLLKIFANEYRLNKELSDDAEERIAMVFTFKALEHEERVGVEERLLILNALFRPHERGSEESMPFPAWEALIKRFEK